MGENFKEHALLDLSDISISFAEKPLLIKKQNLKELFTPINISVVVIALLLYLLLFSGPKGASKEQAEKIVSLEQQITALNSQITSLNIQISGLDTTLAQMKATLAKETATKNEFETKFNKCNTELTTPVKKLKSVTEKFEEVNAFFDKLKPEKPGV
eukprot:TRINITY_DN6731_c0_g1_i1.p1 TRINITY_DN6731_c0_g1~~TRINITY_DN6731_c0_g1_i1.p1  ORF type:complete len:157 (-),score=35.52 TRINITY_DN6731_c0_g1_i1:180-650(-)